MSSERKGKLVRDGRGGAVTVERVQYQPRLAIIAAYVYATGANDDEVAEALGVTVDTIRRWAKSHKEFSRAREESSAFVEARLARSLITAAEGGEKVEVTERFDEDSNTWRPVTRKVTTLPPDAKAIMLWLQSRRPSDWQQRQVLEVQVDESAVDALNAGRERMLDMIREVQGGADQ